MKRLQNSNLKMYLLNGILYAVMFNLYSPFAVKFLQRLGGSELHISLYSALPGLVAVFATIPGTLIVSKCYSKKKITGLFFLISRFMLLCLAFIPQLPPYIAPIIFVVVISLRNFPESVSQTALQSFAGDLFSPEERSNAIALRNRYGVPATLLVTFAAGQILNKLSGTPSQSIKVYQIFFGVAFIIGLIETAVFMLIKEPVRECIPQNNMWSSISSVLRDKKFIRYSAITVAFYFTWQMGWPIFDIYQVMTMGANEWWLSWISIVSSIGAFSGYRFWNSMINKKGNKFVLWTTAIGLALNPLMLMMSFNLYLVVFANLISGFFSAGTTVVLLNTLLDTTPDDDSRVVYIGVYNTFVNLSLAVSPLVSHLILKNSNIYIALAVVALFRVSSSILLFKKARN